MRKQRVRIEIPRITKIPLVEVYRGAYALAFMVDQNVLIWVPVSDMKYKATGWCTAYRITATNSAMPVSDLLLPYPSSLRQWLETWHLQKTITLEKAAKWMLKATRPRNT